MTRPQHKNSPINIRALPAQKALIDRAAAYSNKTRSEFMLEIACQEAENVLLDRQLFFVDKQAYESFIALLESPVEENLGLKALLQDKAPWEK